MNNLHEQFEKQKLLFNKILDFRRRVNELWENSSLKEKSKLRKLRNKFEHLSQICYRVMRALNWKCQEGEGLLDNYSYYWNDYNWETEVKELSTIKWDLKD